MGEEGEDTLAFTRRPCHLRVAATSADAPPPQSPPRTTAASPIQCRSRRSGSGQRLRGWGGCNPRSRGENTEEMERRENGWAVWPRGRVWGEVRGCERRGPLFTFYTMKIYLLL
jgi:hypothetical protein